MTRQPSSHRTGREATRGRKPRTPPTADEPHEKPQTKNARKAQSTTEGKKKRKLVAGSDRTISPDLERWYAKRAKSHTVEVPGASHAVYVSRPKEVAALIEDAASHAR